MKRSKQKGITLIALVITIIVLLILAAVSIATLTGENGILTRASEASEKTEEAEDIENIKWAISESNIPQDGQEEKSEQAVLKEMIEKNTEKDMGIGKKEDDGSYVVTIGDKEYLVSGENVTKMEDGITDKQRVLVASKDKIIFKNTITKQDIEAEYPNYENYQIVGVSASETGEYKTSGEIEGKTGNIEIIGDLQRSTYQYNLKKPMLGDETFFVKVSIDGEERVQKLEVIQGDIVRYEEDKLTFTNLENGTEEDGIWTDVENENFSNGKAKKVQRVAGIIGGAWCNFEFKGTGLDLIFAQEQNNCGYISIRTYEQETMKRIENIDFGLDSSSDEYNMKFRKIRDLDGNKIYSQQNGVAYNRIYDVYGTGKSIIYIDAVDIYR